MNHEIFLRCHTCILEEESPEKTGTKKVQPLPEIRSRSRYRDDNRRATETEFWRLSVLRIGIGMYLSAPGRGDIS